MSSRACPDWPALMELAPDLHFRHYTLAEAHVPVDAFVKLEGLDPGTVAVCCDLEAHVFNPEHTDPRIADALRGTHWIDLTEVAGRDDAPAREP